VKGSGDTPPTLLFSYRPYLGLMSHIDYDGSGELHITGIQAAAECDKSRFDRVMSVCQDSIEANIPEDVEYSHYCMSDGQNLTETKYGGSCEYQFFETAANELYQALSDGETVHINCHHGSSRSVSVATAALGQLLGLTRSEALGLIHYYRPREKYPNSLLMSHARRYISEHTDVSDVPFTGIEN